MTTKRTSSEPGDSPESNHEANASPLQLRECVYGVLIRNNHVLMCHTKSGERIIINFPGGAIDPGEAHPQALIRECAEELGVSIEIKRHLLSSNGTHINPDFPENRQLCHYYLIEADNAPSLLGNSVDVARLEWFSMDELPLARMLVVDQEFALQLGELLREITT